MNATIIITVAVTIITGTITTMVIDGGAGTDTFIGTVGRPGLTLINFP